MRARAPGAGTYRSRYMTDYFHRLGLPRRFSVDTAELERAYLTRSRAIHPDYHQTGSGAELAASLEISAALNEAYTTLQDPLARADYLVMLDGGPNASEHRQMPPEFLAQMLEAREAIDRVRHLPAETAKLDAEFGAQLDVLMAQVGDLFWQIEGMAADSAGRANLLIRIRGLLNAARYVRGLIRDLHTD